MNAGNWTDDQGVTVGEWLNQWLSGLRLSPKTMSNYRSHIRDAWKPALGRMRLRDIRRHHVEAVLVSLREPRTGGAVGNVGRRVETRSMSTVAG